jgi:hypothetical protein
MADADALHIGENSPEQVAFRLLYEIANVEGIEMRGLSGTKKADRKWILDTYAECIIAVRAPQNRDRGRGG